jgi:cytochrome b subunit of formate dehydrogenase
MNDTSTSPGPAPAGQRATSFTRFDLTQRLEHVLLLVSFTTLGITGLAQKFALAWPSQFLLRLLGGIEVTRLIHRGASIVLMVEAIYHILAVLYRVIVQRTPLTMLPVFEDFKHLYQDLRFYLGRRERKARYGRYSYAEKVEYLAVVWGTVIMAITGFMMWNPVATARWLSGEAIPAAKAAHGGEAILAILAIILWHFYHVHVRHFNKSMFTGRMSREEMEEEHPAELAIIESEQESAPASPPALRRRLRVYLPLAALLTLGMVYGVFWFATFETTAAAAAPAGETAPAFVPQTPTPLPPPPPSPTAGLPTYAAWTNDVEILLSERCITCHGQAASGGLSLASYEQALQGGARGPAIDPGNPESSVLVQVQSLGDHPGQMTEAELAGIIDWIRTGAPER